MAVLIVFGAFAVTVCLISIDNFRNIFITKNILCFIFFKLLGSVNKQNVGIASAFTEDNDTSRNRCAVEQILGQTDNRINQVFIHNSLTNFAFACTSEQNAVRSNSGNSSVSAHRCNHMKKKSPVALACRGDSYIKAVPAVKPGFHFKFFFLSFFRLVRFFIHRNLTAGIKAGCPFIQAERHVGNDAVEFHKVAVAVKMLRVGKGG